MPAPPTDPSPTLCLTLPLPPSTNRSSRSGRGRHYTPYEVLRFRDAVARAIAEQLPGHATITYPVAVRVVVYMPRRGLDLDNRDGKVLFDALTRARFWFDDKLVCTRCGIRLLDAAHPRVEVSVTQAMVPQLIDALNAKLARECQKKA